MEEKEEKKAVETTEEAPVKAKRGPKPKKATTEKSGEPTPPSEQPPQEKTAPKERKRTSRKSATEEPKTTDATQKSTSAEIKTESPKAEVPDSKPDAPAVSLNPTNENKPFFHEKSKNTKTDAEQKAEPQPTDAPQPTEKKDSSQETSGSATHTDNQHQTNHDNQHHTHPGNQHTNQPEQSNNHNSYYNHDENRDYRYNKRNKNRHNQQRKNFQEKSKPARTRYLELLKENEESIRKTAHDYQISRTSSMTFPEVTFEVFKNVVESEGGGISACRGILEILADGYGFLRTQMCSIDSGDVYVSNAQIKKLGLRTGDYVVGQTRPPKDNESYQALLRVECINDMEPERARRMPSFDNLTPLYPNQRFNLHVEDNDPSVRIVDLVTPIGKGQRGLIVAPPKAGKTTLLKQIANALTSNHPDIVLFVLLIDERPEEVTDMTRSVEGEVFASTFDQQLNNHIRVSEMVLERAKRLVEQGKDVVILLDSITRLARAYNIAVPSTGQTLSGGVNPLALYKPKKFFGSARKIEFGGSLTILATALIDTGSKMDDVIFEEFKGTGNMELHLDRTLFNKRIFPSINLSKSSTRREELLVPPESLKGMTILRRVFESVSTQEAIELLKKQVKQSRDNELLLSTLLRSADLKNI